MASISFENSGAWNQQTQSENSVNFFSLKNDGDTALVRILHDNTASFDIQTTHDVKVGDGGKTRRVSCLRSNPNEPLDSCPLCKQGLPTKTKIFIHMIQYTDQGPKAVIWERTLKYAQELAGMIKTYGPLSDCLFMVVRNGAAGDIHTTYNIMYAPPTQYPPEQYPKEDLFGDFKVCGTFVMDKTADELNQFIATGSFPKKERPQTAQAQAFNQPIPNTPPVDNVPEFGNRAPINQYQAPPQYGAPAQYGAPQEGGFARPQRY